MKKISKSKHDLTFFLFLLPSVFAFVMVIIIPFFMGIYYSFTDWIAMPGVKVTFVGISNYAAIFKDVTYLNSFIVTVVYAVLNIIVINVFAFFLATLVTQKLKFTGLYRAGFFLPNLIGGIILGYIWQFIFNNVIPAFGGSTGLLWFKENLFLINRNLALLAIVIVGTWQYAGYIMMIYVAAIQGIPDTLLEAAEMDGVRSWQRLWYIIIPLIAPAFTISLFLTLVNSFKQFDVNYALTSGGPSGIFMDRAVKTTEFLALNIYQTASGFNQYAQGQAKAVIFFVIIAVISVVQVRANKKREIEM